MLTEGNWVNKSIDVLVCSLPNHHIICLIHKIVNVDVQLLEEDPKLIINTQPHLDEIYV